MPLLAPSEIKKSTLNSKFLNFSIVIISPPFLASFPLEACTVIIPLFIIQPFSGNELNFAPRQPFVVLPSHNILNPKFFSSLVSIPSK